METPKIVVFVVKRYAVRETEKWRYAVRKAKLERYAVRKGEGVSPSYRSLLFLLSIDGAVLKSRYSIFAKNCCLHYPYISACIPAYFSLVSFPITNHSLEIFTREH